MTNPSDTSPRAQRSTPSAAGSEKAAPHPGETPPRLDRVTAPANSTEDAAPHAPTPHVDLWLCRGRMCTALGGDALAAAVHDALGCPAPDEDGVRAVSPRLRVLPGGCYGLCDQGPNAVLRRWETADVRPSPRTDRLKLRGGPNEWVLGKTEAPDAPAVVAAVTALLDGRPPTAFSHGPGAPASPATDAGGRSDTPAARLAALKRRRTTEKIVPPPPPPALRVCPRGPRPTVRALLDVAWPDAPELRSNAEHPSSQTWTRLSVTGAPDGPRFAITPVTPAAPDRGLTLHISGSDAALTARLAYGLIVLTGGRWGDAQGPVDRAPDALIPLLGADFDAADARARLAGAQSDAHGSLRAASGDREKQVTEVRGPN